MILKTELYNHQNEAVEKLSKYKIGALYFEMGTGKTLTALKLIQKRIEEGKVTSTLWLCPCSIKKSTKKEIDKHSANAPILICGIESLSISVKTLSKVYDFVQSNNVYLIVDESSLVKNHYAKRTENITRLAEMCEYKLILNGTPISRCEQDLFSQWYILDWRVLGYKSFWSFSNNHLEYDDYGKLRRCLNTDYLAKKISYYSVECKKKDVISNLLNKNYIDVAFRMTQSQSEHYNCVRNEFLDTVDECDSSTIYRMFTALQHVVCGRRIVSNAKHKIKTISFFNKIEDNPRFKKLIECIENHIKNEKVIIWCKYTHEIVEIENYLKETGKSCSVLFGGLSQKKRQHNIDLFESSSQILIANKNCGGFGLNLQFCNNAIYYSNDFDYSTRVQSEDRIHRIGQAKPVYIYDIYTGGTIDELIMSSLARKERLSNNLKYYLNLFKN